MIWFFILTLHSSFHCLFPLVQSLSRVRSFVTPWTAARQASLSITNSYRLLKLMFISSVMPSNLLILCCPLLLLSSIIPSIRVFSSESVLYIRWPKYWSFSFSFSPSSEYSRLISFRIDWLDLLAVQGTLKSLLQHRSSVQFSSLQSLSRVWPHGLQHAKLPCPSPTSGAKHQFFGAQLSL